MRTMTLGEMLPEQGVREVELLVKQGKTTAADFRAVLAKYEAQLAEKDVLVDYLAYVLEWMINHKPVVS